MTAVPAVEALLFDVFGTVVDWRGSIARLGAAFAEGRDLPPVDWAAFADAWRARYQPAMAEVREGRRPFVRLDVLHRENLDAILADFGLESLSAAERDELNLFWHRLDPWPDSVAGMTRLKRRLILAAQSNGNIGLIVDMAKYGGLPWDVVLGAEVVGAYKPRPEAYLGACERLGRAPGRCLMVAAHNDDLAAAADCGLRTAFVRRPEEKAPGETYDLVPTGDWDLVVDSLDELADRLGC
ncbi:2-haloacid dehalogenase [Tistlia consotensis]|uniref:(S)-2-haloacid dehalogenase n=1 Tax=Tistlia consotensis USBA 355 TaxID=560819 RepID=A0A1Y6BLF7_9PROT|nr:haloacid dehalogenase type II [Tistlia consotensis]SMF16505.1 2-haloacid dehalogenase [Tistlia consotensis USBA 355]SNR41097.1 2-haloacid dehalogenase [Tistlia consotensis]